MRIADKMQYDQVKGNVAKNRTQMSELQNQAATQKRVNKPSDDPLAASRVLSTRIDLQSNKQFTKNLSYAKSFLETTDSSLGEVTELLMRAKELAIAQSNDASSNDDSRRMVASEVQQLTNSITNVGNRKLADRFIFGGFRTQAPPFTKRGDYQGDEGEMNIHADKEAFIPMNVPGSRVFLGIGINANGAARANPPQARSIEELDRQNEDQPILAPPELNGDLPGRLDPVEEERGVPRGVNVFRVMRDLEISLRTNDKAGVQDTLEQLDAAIGQVVSTRSQVGARASSIDGLNESMAKTKIQNMEQISSLEDADVFETVSDINKTQSTLQATLQTSGKLVQQSLMDFLR